MGVESQNRFANVSHYHGKTVLTGSKMKRHHKYLNTCKKPYWLTRRRSKIKLPTRFLLGGTITDPLNLQGIQNESGRKSDTNSVERNSQVLTPKRSRRIGFPNITDVSDPLNLKNTSDEGQELCVSLDAHTTSIEKRKNAGSDNHCQVLCTIPCDGSEDSLEQSCLDYSADIKQTVTLCENCLSLCEQNQCYTEELDCAINVCNSSSVLAEAACELTNDTSDQHMPSVVKEMEAVALPQNKLTGCDKIVSPAVSSHRKRKRQRQNGVGETVTSAISSHKSSCKKIREKFHCGNYIAYYGYRNVDRVKDPRLELLPKELFEGRDVLDIGCNAGIVTIAVASCYLPKSILGIDVDQRLIGLAKRNVRRYMDESSYPLCLKTAFGPVAASLMPSTEFATFPHNILFQVVRSSNVSMWCE